MIIKYIFYIEFIESINLYFNFWRIFQVFSTCKNFVEAIILLSTTNNIKYVLLHFIKFILHIRTLYYPN